jgi:hypothetical protein
MKSLAPFVILVPVTAGILGLFAIVVAFRLRPAKQSRIALTAAVLPALIMLVLFYSLAIHLHHSLGAWPASIGDRDFPQLLITHERISESYFWILMLFSICVWPIAYILCTVIRRWQVCLYYLGVYALAFLVCFGATLLAPSQFWYWWLD